MFDRGSSFLYECMVEASGNYHQVRLFLTPCVSESVERPAVCHHKMRSVKNEKRCPELRITYCARSGQLRFALL